MGEVKWRESTGHDIISNPVASELKLPTVGTRQCRFPTTINCRETALPCPLYHSGATGIYITTHPKNIPPQGEMLNP
jgi:hypothetical protein